MRLLISAILLLSASLAVVVNTGNPFVRARHTQNARDVQARSPKQYKLVDHYSAQHFMDESLWSYFTDADPTGGQTKYLSHADASNAGLAYVQDGQAILAVDSKNDLPLGAERDSVRITSTKAYNGGLFIADFTAMAYGCAVWPAYWSLGEKWPDDGEIDIIEGVNLHPTNQYTLHTGPGSDCVLVKNPPTTSGSAPYTANALSTECKSSGSSDAGCSFSDTKNTSFGYGFNMVGVAFSPIYWTTRDSRRGTSNASQSLKTFSTVSPTRLPGQLPSPFGHPSAATLLPISITTISSSTPRSAVGGQVAITRILGVPELAVTESPKGRTSSTPNG